MYTNGAFPPEGSSTAVVAAQHDARAVLQALPLGVCTVDTNGCIVSLNPEAERMLGWGEASCVGMALHDLIACWAEAPDTHQTT